MKPYTHRIKNGALLRNQSLFRYSENTINLVDGELCRIIDVIAPDTNFFKENTPQDEITTFFEVEIGDSKYAYIQAEDLIRLEPEEFTNEN